MCRLEWPRRRRAVRAIDVRLRHLPAAFLPMALDLHDAIRRRRIRRITRIPRSHSPPARRTYVGPEIAVRVKPEAS